eukprot:ANDGO_02050.mRNA.1 hypothetical protein
MRRHSTSQCFSFSPSSNFSLLSMQESSSSASSSQAVPYAPRIDNGKSRKTLRRSAGPASQSGLPSDVCTLEGLPRSGAPKRKQQSRTAGAAGDGLMVSQLEPPSQSPSQPDVQRRQPQRRPQLHSDSQPGSSTGLAEFEALELHPTPETGPWLLAVPEVPSVDDRCSTSMTEQNARIVARGVLLEDVPRTLLELQRRDGCVLVLDAHHVGGTSSDVEPVLSAKGDQQTAMREMGFTGRGLHLSDGVFSSLIMTRRLGRSSNGDYLSRSRLHCNFRCRNCATAGPSKCTYRVEVVVPRPLVCDDSERRRWNRQKAKGAVPADYVYHRIIANRCNVFVYGEHTPGSVFKENSLEAVCKQKPAIDEALINLVVAPSGTTTDPPLVLQTRPLEVYTQILSSIPEPAERSQAGAQDDTPSDSTAPSSSFVNASSSTVHSAVASLVDFHLPLRNAVESDDRRVAQRATQRALPSDRLYRTIQCRKKYLSRKLKRLLGASEHHHPGPAPDHMSDHVVEQGVHLFQPLTNPSTAENDVSSTPHIAHS